MALPKTMPAPSPAMPDRATSTDESPRAALARLVHERGSDFARLSRLIGRNPAYIQQFVQRGTPRVLAERDRRLLADYFEVDEVVLGAPVESVRRGPRHPDSRGHALVDVPRLDIGASAGPGALVEDDRADSRFGFDARWLRKLSATPDQLAIIRVAGDSMQPTLSDGDDIMVDSGDGAARLRDGVYVLRRDDSLLVKRIARGSVAGQVTIISDNPAYPDEPGVPVRRLAIVGRVVWAGRRLS
jgi:phage repressor protein C with HTH and peptisase S24 domain